MDRRFLAVPLLAVLAAAPAAPDQSRRYSVTSFDRIRVDGAFDVELNVGTGATGVAIGDDDAIGHIALTVDGQTLTVHRDNSDWGERGRRDVRRVPVVKLTTPMLRGALVTGGGKLNIIGLKAQRAYIAVNGVGELALAGAMIDQLNATIIGTGVMRLAGRAQRTQLLANGSGVMDATKLDVNDLTIRLDGPGQIDAAARYTANVTNTGLGQISVAGSPACTVKSPAGGPVRCGR